MAVRDPLASPGVATLGPPHCTLRATINVLLSVYATCKVVFTLMLLLPLEMTSGLLGYSVLALHS